MSHLIWTFIKYDGRGNIRNLQRIEEREREEDTTHLNQIAHQILNHLNQIVVLIHIRPHLTLVLQAMTHI